METFSEEEYLSYFEQVPKYVKDVASKYNKALCLNISIVSFGFFILIVLTIFIGEWIAVLAFLYLLFLMTKGFRVVSPENEFAKNDAQRVVHELHFATVYRIKYLNTEHSLFYQIAGWEYISVDAIDEIEQFIRYYPELAQFKSTLLKIAKLSKS